MRILVEIKQNDFSFSILSNLFVTYSENAEYS